MAGRRPKDFDASKRNLWDGWRVRKKRNFSRAGKFPDFDPVAWFSIFLFFIEKPREITLREYFFQKFHQNSYKWNSLWEIQISQEERK